MVTMTQHRFIDDDNVIYEIDAALNYTLGSNYRIVVNESATGSGGVVYFNGIGIRTIPIQARIIGSSIDEINTKANRLKKLADSGKIIEFVTPYKPLVSNKYFIQDLKFEAEAGKAFGLAFSCTLIEFRQANVRTTSINLVNYSSKQAFLDVYNERTGNL